MAILVLCSGALTVSGVQPPVLSTPSRAASTFTFTVAGDYPADYVIEASSDLKNWSPVVTNWGPGLTRSICVTNPPRMKCFYRASRLATAMFQVAIAAKGTISLSGGGVIDAFDSSDPRYSTGGLYNIAKRKDTAWVVTNDRGSNSITVAGYIYGSAGTGPGGVVTAQFGAIGESAWIEPNNGIQPGHVVNNINLSFPDVSAPLGFSGWPAPVAGTYPVAGTNYNYMLGDGGYYQPGSFTIAAGTKMVVTGKSVLYVGGNLAVSGAAYVYIAPGASLTLYAGGTTAYVSGGGIINASGSATNFSYFGLPTNTGLTFSTSASLIGTIYAPEASLTYSGAGSWSGACAVKTFTNSGGSVFHYDENLARFGPRF